VKFATFSDEDGTIETEHFDLGSALNRTRGCLLHVRVRISKDDPWVPLSSPEGAAVYLSPPLATGRPRKDPGEFFVPISLSIPSRYLAAIHAAAEAADVKVSELLRDLVTKHFPLPPPPPPPPRVLTPEEQRLWDKELEFRKQQLAQYQRCMAIRTARG
jgi:hypothetical protein